MMLKVENLNVYYGSIHAIKDLSFEVNEGEIVSLIGANGAGKTTTLHSIQGLLKAASGNVTFMDKNINGLSADKVVRLGLGQVPEGRRVFQELTVEENLRLGAFSVKDKQFIADEYARVMELFPRLKERRKQQAGTLSGGEQQMLAMGRALMGKPKMLLMDEPSMGLAPILVKDIFSIIKECNKDGVTILLVEQNANMALSISDRIAVMNKGEILQVGTPAEVYESPADSFVADFIGENNFFDGVVTEIIDKEFAKLHNEKLGSLVFEMDKPVKVGDKVNLEKSITLATPLGGHLVTGDVDCEGKVVSITPEGIAKIYEIEIERKYMKYIVEKGRVTLDGASLTVMKLGDTTFGVSLIPHTQEMITLGKKKVGDYINVETDLIGKYIERFMKFQDEPSEKKEGITMEFLLKNGF